MPLLQLYFIQVCHHSGDRKEVTSSHIWAADKEAAARYFDDAFAHLGCSLVCKQIRQIDMTPPQKAGLAKVELLLPVIFYPQAMTRVTSPIMAAAG